MLKKRSRAASSKQGLMSEYPSSFPSQGFSSRATASIFASPRLLVGISPKVHAEAEPVKSPTSTLEPKPFSSSLLSDRTPWKPMPEPASSSRYNRWQNGDSGHIGLVGIVDALREEESGSNSPKLGNGKLIFGSRLKIQIPSLLPLSVSSIGSLESPHSPMEFGIKTMANRRCLATNSPQLCTGTIPLGEMELSEDYTCVIMHGPTPRTTHIFDNCVIESCGDQLRAPGVTRRHVPVADQLRYPSENFLSFCHSCKKDLRQGKDIYIYRGEKAFCSSECRYREILFDEGSGGKCPPDGL